MPVPGLSLLGLKHIRGFASILCYINPTIIIIMLGLLKALYRSLYMLLQLYKIVCHPVWKMLKLVLHTMDSRILQTMKRYEVSLSFKFFLLSVLNFNVT